MDEFWDAFWQLNLSQQLLSGIAAVVVPYLIQKCYIKWKRNIINALNYNLKYGVNPIVQHWLMPSIGIITIALTLIIVKCTQNLLGCLLLCAIPITYVINWLYINSLKKDRKGLIGIVSDQIRMVNEISSQYPKESDIFFATHTDKNGNPISYEKRKIRNIEDIVEERNNKIVPYYEKLQEKINQERNINQELFKVTYLGKKLHVCDFLANIAYSEEKIRSHVDKVIKTMQNDRSINFIGDKVGISGYNLIKKELTLDIYLTDHFTFKVFKSIFFDHDLKDIFQLIIRRTNLANNAEKRLLIESLKYLLSSFGIDIIVHGRMANGKKGMLVAVRSGNIERKGICKLHVPVNESFSRTDIINNDKYSPKLCVIRGIEEELGIPQSMIEKAKIDFHDFALVCDEGEIGLGCYVDFSSVMPLEQLRMYPGQDKFLEIRDLIIVPYPPFFWNPDNYPIFFYKKTFNDIFCTTWESFTTLLYQRCIIRNAQINLWVELFFNTITVILFNAFLLYLFEIGQWRNSLYLFVVQLFPSLIINLGTQFFNRWKMLIESFNSTFFKPLITQWGPDVTVLQATASNLYVGENTNNNDKHPVSGYICFGNAELQNDSLNRFVLEEPPYCSVRREIAKNNAESPISFYRLKYHTEETNYNKLFFALLQYSKIGENITITLEVNFNDRNSIYHFTKNLQGDEIPKLYFIDKFDDNEIESYSNYYGIPKSILKKYRIAHLPKDFQNTYRPLDLFRYQNNYYWSLVEPYLNLSDRADGMHVRLTSKTDFYKEYLDGKKENQRFYITGTQQQIADFLINFISNKKNRQRISPLDIYILQLALIREGDGCEGIVLAEKKKPLIWRMKEFVNLYI